MCGMTVQHPLIKATLDFLQKNIPGAEAIVFLAMPNLPVQFAIFAYLGFERVIYDALSEGSLKVQFDRPQFKASTLVTEDDCSCQVIHQGEPIGFVFVGFPIGSDHMPFPDRMRDILKMVAKGLAEWFPGAIHSFAGREQ